MPKWAKRLAAGLAIGSALLVALALTLPLVVRGRRLGWAVERATSSLCGTVHLRGGKVSVTAIFDLLFGRPTYVELDGLDVLAPDGDEVLVAERISLRLGLGLHPRRADVRDLHVTSARWLFIEHKDEGRMDFAEIVRRVPPEGRQACLARPVPRPVRPIIAPPPRAAAPTPTPAVIEVHGALLEDIDLRLDFATWALVLNGTSASGQVRFEVGGSGPPLTFEARGIVARKGGELRVGRRAQQWAALTPFDHVQIDRFSTDPAAPADMVLEVGGAQTGRAVLAGHARFTDIFPWGRRSRWPGMDLDASWHDAGDVVQALKEVWGISRRFPGRMDGSVWAQLRGPFVALAGRAHAAGPHTALDLAVDLAPDKRRVDAGIDLDGLETSRVLDPALEPLLGGRLSGKLRAHLVLGQGLLGLAAAIDEASLRLDRRVHGPWPGRFAVSTHALPGPADADEAQLYFSGAELRRGTLAVPELRTRLGEAAVNGRLTVRILDEDGEPRPRPIIDAHAESDQLPVEHLLPRALVGGQVAMNVDVKGPSDNLGVALSFGRGSAIRLVGEPLALPARLEARLRGGDRLTVAPARLGDPRGPALELRGNINFNGPVDAELGVLRFPLERLLALVHLPASGRLDGRLRLTGRTREPRLEGEVALSDVRVRGVALGDGAVTLVPDRGATAIDGRLVPALGLHGRLSYGSGPGVVAALDVVRLPLGPFLRVRGLDGELSARANLRTAGRDFSLDAELSRLDLAYRLPKSGATLAVASQGPTHLRGDERGLALDPLRLRGSGLDAVAEGGSGATTSRGASRPSSPSTAWPSRCAAWSGRLRA